MTENRTKYNFEVFEEQVLPEREKINDKYDAKRAVILQKLKELKIKHDAELRKKKEDTIEGDKEKELEDLLDQID